MKEKKYKKKKKIVNFQVKNNNINYINKICVKQ